jgi:hypothetical protein
MRPSKTLGSDLFNTGRICDCCGANQDTTNIESFRILRADCWKQYRLDGFQLIILGKNEQPKARICLNLSLR